MNNPTRKVTLTNEQSVYILDILEQRLHSLRYTMEKYGNGKQDGQYWIEGQEQLLPQVRAEVDLANTIIEVLNPTED